MNVTKYQKTKKQKTKNTTSPIPKDVLTPVLVVMKCFAVFAKVCGESGTCRKSKGYSQGKRKQTVQKTKYTVSDQTINFDSVPDDEASIYITAFVHSLAKTGTCGECKSPSGASASTSLRTRLFTLG